MNKKILERKIINLDKQLYKIQQQIAEQKEQFIELYGIEAWDDLFDKLQNTY